MKKDVLFLCLGVLLLASCKMIRLSDYDMQSSSQSLNIPMDVDIPSLIDAYSLGRSEANIDLGGYGGPIDDDGTGVIIGTTRRVSQREFNDKRIRDAISLFEDFHHDISQSDDSDLNGKIVYRISRGDSKSAGWGWRVLSVATLTIPNWFGMPFATGRSEIRVELLVLNCQDEVVRRWIGSGFSKVPLALYHGYYGFSDPINDDYVRKSNIEAIKEALEEIDHDLQNESAVLISELENCQSE